MCIILVHVDDLLPACKREANSRNRGRTCQAVCNEGKAHHLVLGVKLIENLNDEEV